MDNHLVLIGNESSVIYYNLNKQFSNIKKIVITKEIILNSFDGVNIRNLIADLSTDSDSYSQIISDPDTQDYFKANLKNDLYQEIQKHLPKISANLMEIQLKDYNFVSSMSNARFNVCLRTESFSITKYYEEKGQVLSAIRSLIKEYLSYEGNVFRLQRLEDFQIEIYESEEIHKTIKLKKEGSSILLSSSFAFSRISPFDHTLGDEFYFSIGEDFQFYKNSQTTAFLRDHNKFVEKEINVQEKVLSNEELILINENTKNINDALIEMYINSKGALKILNISIPENSIYSSSEAGFVINRSNKNYDTVSLVTLRDNLEEDLPNPKYLLLRNDGEVKEILEDIRMIEYLDGIVLTTNFYSPILDRIGKVLDIDIVYFKDNLQKNLNLSVDIDSISFGGEGMRSYSSTDPFNSIISEQRREKDEYLEKLRNIDLDSPPRMREDRQIGTMMTDDIGDIAKSIISSPQSSTRQMGRDNNDSMYSSIGASGKGEKLSAISMLAKAALEKPQKREPEQISHSSHSSHSSLPSHGTDELRSIAPPRQQERASSPSFYDEDEDEEVSSYFDTPKAQSRPSQASSSHSLSSMGSQSTLGSQYGSSSSHSMSSSPSSHSHLPHHSSQPHSLSHTSRSSMETYEREETPRNSFAGASHSSSPYSQSNSPQRDFSSSSPSSFASSSASSSKYDNVLATKILTNPDVSASDSYFVDMETLPQVQSQADIHLMITDMSELSSNPNIKYIIPAGIAQGNDLRENISILINSVNEYFLIEDESARNYFFNITNLEPSIKRNFIKTAVKRFGKISLVLSKEDVGIIEEFIDKIESIYIDDIQTNEEYEYVRGKILSCEKNFLMRNCS